MAKPHVRPDQRLARDSGPLVQWLKAQAHYFYQTSVIVRFKIRGNPVFDDDVLALQRNSLALFFYNQRALVFGASALFLILFLAAALLLGAPSTALRALLVLSGAWVLGVVITLVLHRSFKKTLSVWGAATERRYLLPAFDRYFLLDSMLVFCLVVIGKVSSVHALGGEPLPFDGFLFLLLANTIVYGAYVGSRYEHNSVVTLTLALLFILATGIVTSFARRDWFSSPLWADQVLMLAPFIAMAIITVLSIWMMSWLRTIEHDVTRRHLELLGEFEQALSVPRQTTQRTCLAGLASFPGELTSPFSLFSGFRAA